MRKRYLTGLALIGSFSVVIAAGLGTSVQAAERCVALKEVTTGQAVINKQIKVALFGNNNFNTDFAVPAGTNFQFFRVKFVPENDATYTVKVNFKYSNTSSATVFNQTGFVEREKIYERNFISPTSDIPYQVNTDIGGDNNTAYRVSVTGCYHQ